MTDDTQRPSYDPANDGSMVGLFREVMRSLVKGLDDMLPATVIAFDRTTNRARVQPQIRIVKTDDTTMSRAAIAEVPVFQIGGGGFLLNFNLKPGDLGWIKASDRDISLFTQSYKENAPNTQRMHSFEDGIFFPDVMRGFTINAEDDENVVLQTLDGSQRVAIWADRVKVTGTNVILQAAEEITLKAPLTRFTGNIIGDGSDGMLNAEFIGTFHATGDVTAGSISLEGHHHTGVQTGSGNTGNPI